MRLISIYQNVLAARKANYDRPKWKGISIVEDAAAVTNVTDKLKARDVSSVLDDELALADAFAANGWIYTASYTKKNTVISLRAGLSGFDIYSPIIPSGEGGIYNQNIITDTSIAILSVGGE